MLQKTFFGFEGVPFSNDTSITCVENIEIGDVQLKKIDEEVVIISTGLAEIEVSGFMEKSKYYFEYNRKDDIFVDDSDWNDHVMSVSCIIKLEFELTLFYSIKEKEIYDCKIFLPQEIKNDWPYK